jgi:DNA-binding transcriptional MerR regulator
METGLTIQQVAKRTGLSIDTLRYYERIGLLETVGRAQNGHRRYTPYDLAWIDLLMRLRDTGMPRAQMVRFAQLRRQGSATLTERRLMLEQHQRSLEQHMQELEQHMVALRQKIVRLKEREVQRNAASDATHAFGHSEAEVIALDPEAE